MSESFWPVFPWNQGKPGSFRERFTESPFRAVYSNLLSLW